MSAEPTLSEDIQGDARWMSMVRLIDIRMRETTRNPKGVLFPHTLCYVTMNTDTC